MDGLDAILERMRTQILPQLSRDAYAIIAGNLTEPDADRYAACDEFLQFALLDDVEIPAEWLTAIEALIDSGSYDPELAERGRNSIARHRERLDGDTRHARWNRRTGGANQVTLRDGAHGPLTNSLLTVRHLENGDLLFSAQDMGAGIAPDGGDEYEYTMVVSGQNVPALLALLGADQNQDPTGFLVREWSGGRSFVMERLLNDSGIDVHTDSYY